MCSKKLLCICQLKFSDALNLFIYARKCIIKFGTSGDTVVIIQELLNVSQQLFRTPNLNGLLNVPFITVYVISDD